MVTVRRERVYSELLRVGDGFNVFVLNASITRCSHAGCKPCKIDILSLWLSPSNAMVEKKDVVSEVVER